MYPRSLKRAVRRFYDVVFLPIKGKIRPGSGTTPKNAVGIWFLQSAGCRPVATVFIC